MLTYRDYVYAAFTDYAAAQTAVITIPEQIEVERLRRETLRAQKTDGDRVQGGGLEGDEAWLSSIAKEDYLRRRLEECTRKVETIGRLLADLEDDERDIVTRLIIQKRRNGVGELAEDWGVDERTVFRAKDRTLKKLARMLTGEARA